MRVVLIDDHRVFRDSLRIALTQLHDIEVVGHGGLASEAEALTTELTPDLLILDLLLDDGDGVSVIRDLRRREIATKVLVLTAHQNNHFVRNAFETGAQGYALKSQPLTEVVEAIQTVHGGGRYLAPTLGPLPTESSRPRRPGLGDADLLSRREREIYDLILQGQSSRRIASTLTISLKTVETHRAHINRKLGVRSPAELIRMAALQGLVGPETN